MTETQDRIILFGVRSPLLPDYEETLERSGTQVVAAVSADKLRPRLLDRSALIDLADINEQHHGLPFIACAFSPKRRNELANMACKAGLVAAAAVIDRTAIVANSTRLGNGSYVGAGVVIGAAGMLGEHVFINRSSNLGHHAFIDDYASVGPGCTLAGNVHLGRQAFVGAGSVLLPGVRIGDGAVVAAGSVVRSHVADGTLVAGNPAVLKRESVSTTVYGEEGEE